MKRKPTRARQATLRRKPRKSGPRGDAPHAELAVLSTTPGLRDRIRITLAASPVRRGRAPGGTGRQRRGQDASMRRAAAIRRMIRGLEADPLARLLAALAHPQRIRILMELLAGKAGHQKLQAVTGLLAGPLYHHVRELRLAGLIGPKARDTYVLTRKGQRSILASLAMGRLCR